ncbi:MAG: hypothetical protein HY458_00955 [Parcubacteria group bacterium]|nr:hypothetical protein [Parcubacteria group bacterium]
MSLLNLLWEFLDAWWWLFFPFVLFPPARFLWLWWRMEVFDTYNPYMMLELMFPRQVLRPIQTMENVFMGFWQMYDPANPREKWFEGKYLLRISLEIVSIEGSIHFYMRFPRASRKLIESAIYSQYQDAELSEVEDYTKNVPQDIPNKDWDLWGTNYMLEKPDVYPIKTYAKFFEESMMTPEEKRMDPLALLLEGLTTLGPGEQLWLQFLLRPITQVEYQYNGVGKKIVDVLVRRPKAADTSLRGQLQSSSNLLITGQLPEAPKAQEIIPPEMKLTPGEKVIVTAIEEKIGKYGFLTSMRFMYVAKRENYFSPAKAVVMSFFSQLSTWNLNNMRPLRDTITKVHTIPLWFLDRRRVFTRKRRLFRNFTKRLPPFFPDAVRGMYLLNTEEMATIFHIPSEMTVTTQAVQRVETKKGQAVPNIPQE